MLLVKGRPVAGSSITTGFEPLSNDEKSPVPKTAGMVKT